MREMKYSGVDIIGDIPDEWSMIRMKYLCDITTGDGDTQDAENNGSYPFYVRSPIIERSNRYTFDGEGILMAGDGVGAGRVFHHAFGQYAVHQRVYRLFNFHNINTDFLMYYNSTLFPNEMDRGSAQSTVPSVRLPMLQNFNVCLPSIYEQQAIVSFLDKKCTAIDEAIERYKKIIERLNEIVISEISYRVNAGLNDNVELRKTQYAWLDRIPTHWTTNKVKYISNKSVSYGVIKLYEPDENGIKVLRCSDVQKGYIVPDHIRTITKELSDEYARTILSPGDVVVNVRGTLGGCAVVPENMNGYNVAREVAVISPHRDKYDSRFVMYCMLSDHFANYRTETLSGAVYMGINMETLGNYVCPIPPIQEQTEISDYLDDFCSKTRNSINCHNLIISKLEEYRKSLIYHAVTGKIDCREAV